MGGREEPTTRSFAPHNVRNGGSIEAIGSQHFEKNLRTEVGRRIGEQRTELVETETHADGTVGTFVDKMLAQRGEKGGVELFDMLQI